MVVGLASGQVIDLGQRAAVKVRVHSAVVGPAAGEATVRPVILVVGPVAAKLEAISPN